MVGIKSLDYKERRRQRRRNHIARDLKSDKYYQRIVAGRKRREINDNGEYFYEDYDPDLDP